MEFWVTRIVCLEFLIWIKWFVEVKFVLWIKWVVGVECFFIMIRMMLDNDEPAANTD